MHHTLSEVHFTLFIIERAEEFFYAQSTIKNAEVNAMQLSVNELRNKIKGCYTGKNIGGTFGAPFECKRQVNTVTFYTQDLSMGPPANDDLDLQLVWLNAVEKFGRTVDSHILGEYWLSYIIPNWVEYGMAKANLRTSLLPPLSGYIDNTYGNSCGAFIRSEIWACLAPGHPEIAARYAYEDAIVDHCEEGAWGEVLYAAMQSSAFVENDYRKLIDIGLSYIPEDCDVSKAVRMAVSCYENGVPVPECRIQIHNAFPGTFGIQGIMLKDIDPEGSKGMVNGRPGYDAPENIAFSIAAWLYGENDFEKSLLIANSFGEDTDCICASLCSTLGILLGEDAIPSKWKDPLNDKISTCCIKNTSIGLWIPDTATELAERILRDIPLILDQDHCDIFGAEGLTVTCRENEDLFCESSDAYMHRINSFCKNPGLTVRETTNLSPYVIRKKYPAFYLMIDLNGSINYQVGKTRTISVTVSNDFYWNEQHWVNITAYTKDDVTIESNGDVKLPLNNLSGTCAKADISFVADNGNQGSIDIMIGVGIIGRHSQGAIKVTLYQEAVNADE